MLHVSKNVIQCAISHSMTFEFAQCNVEWTMSIGHRHLCAINVKFISKQNESVSYAKIEALYNIDFNMISIIKTFFFDSFSSEIKHL